MNTARATESSDLPPASTTPAASTSSLLERRRRAMVLAARVGCDPRTAQRALERGPGAVRTLALREALERELALEAERRAVATEPPPIDARTRRVLADVPSRADDHKLPDELPFEPPREGAGR